MKILTAGDTHGSPQQILYLYEQAAKFDADVLFILGDYGFWEHHPDGGAFLDFNAECAQEFGFPTYWLDGNHENHVLLREKYGPGAGRTHQEFWPIRDGVFHSPRGHRFEWDDVTFLTLGGAFSIDRNRLRVGSSFWFEEIIEPEDVSRSIVGGEVDVMLCHDVTSGVDMQRMFARRGFNYALSRESEQNRNFIRDVVEEVKPDYLYHGHYHVRYEEHIRVARGTHICKITGLSCEGSGAQSWTILDTAEFAAQKAA